MVMFRRSLVARLRAEIRELQNELFYAKVKITHLQLTIRKLRRQAGHRLEHSDEVLIQTHNASQCAGEYCTIHRMSDHAMRSFPQHWRSDAGFMERICPHGIGHPDPDEPWPVDSASWVHGCDGCCKRHEVNA